MDNLLDFIKPHNEAAAADKEKMKYIRGEAREFVMFVKPDDSAQMAKYYELIKQTWDKKERWDGMKKLLALPSEQWNKIIEQAEEKEQ